MGRKKKYSRDQAAETALFLFWEKGYVETSLKDLEAATGMNKFSLYEAFDSKRGLFLEAADLYAQKYLNPVFESFEPQEAENFLDTVIEQLGSKAGMGCLLLNAGVECGGKDPEISRRIADSFGKITKKMLEHSGSQDRAEAFTALVKVLMTLSRLGSDVEELRRVRRGFAPIVADSAKRKES